MRAILEPDPASGFGYGLLRVTDTPDQGEPLLIIKRLADGLTFAPDGWEKGENSFNPERWTWLDGSYQIWLGPEIINDLDQHQHYELTLSGIGSCALIIPKILKSNVIETNGIDAYAPPPDQVNFSPNLDFPGETVYEGVEPTPIINPDMDEPETPTGVASVPVAQKKKYGCLVLGIGLFIVWAVGSWLLWHVVKNAPVNNNEEEKLTFEIIPKSTERTSPDDTLDDEKMIPQK